MSNTILFGGSGFLSVGRSAPSLDVSNKHVFIKNLDDLSILNKLEFEKVIFLIGSSNHHEINKSATMGIDFNVYPLKKILSFLKLLFLLNTNSIIKIIITKAEKLALQAIENANNIDENNLKLVFNKKRPEEKKNNDKM